MIKYSYQSDTVHHTPSTRYDAHDEGDSDHDDEAYGYYSEGGDFYDTSYVEHSGDEDGQYYYDEGDEGDETDEGDEADEAGDGDEGDTRRQQVEDLVRADNTHRTAGEGPSSPTH